MSKQRNSSGPCGYTRRGVTLLEIVLAMGILVVVSSMTFWFYSSALATSESGTDSAYKLRLGRVVLNRISTEIRHAAAITVDERVGIKGEAEHIWLSSYRVPSREQNKERSLRDEPRPAEYDLVKVEYKIARHREILDEDGYEFALGLARVEGSVPRALPPLPDKKLEDDEWFGGDQGESDEGEDEPPDDEPLEDDLIEGESPEGGAEGGSASMAPTVDWEELYAPEIRYLRFCYFDGNRWWDSWEVAGESPLPQLVQVTIGFVGHPPFGEERGVKVVNEEFCTCQNEDPVDCEPLAKDQFSAVVRVPQADPLFRSRISRETQALVEEMTLASEESGEEDDEFSREGRE